MTSFVALLRGINVGGKNLIGMSDLVDAFREAGYEDARTHSQSGNVLFTASKAAGLESDLERMLRKRFDIPLLVIVKSKSQLAAIVAAAPPDHGSSTLRSEVFFLKSPLTAAGVDIPELRQGVDSITRGKGVLYFSRVTAEARRTRITQLMAMPVFKQMTVRTWKTVTRLLDLIDP